MPSTKRPNRNVPANPDVEKTKAAFLVDFQKQMEKNMLDIDKKVEAILERASNSLKMYEMSVPKRIRDMTDKDFFYGGGAGNKENKSENNVNEDKEKSKMAVNVDEQVMSIKKEVQQTIDAEVKELRTTRKQKLKTPMPPPSSTGVRRSTRKRCPVLTHDFATPLNKGHGRRAKGGGATSSISLRTPMPMITPKIDLQIPLEKTVKREAKPTEVLFSLDGSPVAPVVQTTVKKVNKGRKKNKEKDMWRVSLAGGKAMMIPMNKEIGDSQQQLELEEADRQKLVTMRSKLDCLLDMGKIN